MAPLVEEVPKSGPAPALTDDAGSYGATRTGLRSAVRPWTASALRDLLYAGAVFVWSIVAFTIVVTGVTVTLSLLVFIVGVFVWVGFAHVMRWTTRVDRRLAGWQSRRSLPAVYRRPADRGFMALLKTVTQDPQTWRDFSWLWVTSIVGFTLGLVAITAAGIVVAYVSMPIWFWAISDAEGQYALTNLGLFTVDTLGEALAAALIGIALTPLALLLARGCAKAHAALAEQLLSPSVQTSVQAGHQRGDGHGNSR